MNVLIAGGGIGGLTAALCLLEEGHDVTVFERSAKLSEIGAGIQLGANAVRVLYALGLRQKLDDIAVKPNRIDLRLYDTGEDLMRTALGARYHTAYGAPYYHIHRGDLHQLLVDALRAKAPSAIELNAECCGFEETAQGIRLKLSDGRIVTGDMLVGSDGIHSTIRKQILGDTPANWTGCVAWRGTVPIERLPDGFMDKVVTNFVGPQKHVVLYYLRSMKLVNLVGVVENESWRDESWTVKAPWEELKADYHGWHDTVQVVIDALDRDECYRWALFNRLPVDNWSTNRATLLGDAAHATLPFMASGAAMAIEDGMILSRSVGKATSVPEALQCYQRNRLERTARIQTESTAMKALYHLPDGEAFRAAFAGQPTHLDDSEPLATSWLGMYDPVTVDLD